jgi:hypothetical protein
LFNYGNAEEKNNIEWKHENQLMKKVHVCICHTVLLSKVYTFLAWLAKIYKSCTLVQTDARTLYTFIMYNLNAYTFHNKSTTKSGLGPCRIHCHKLVWWQWVNMLRYLRRLHFAVTQWFDWISIEIPVYNNFNTIAQSKVTNARFITFIHSGH